VTHTEIISLVMGVGGLGIAALTLILNHRARVAPYRHALYNKQLEGYAEIVRVMSEWYNHAFSFIHKHFLHDDETRIQVRKESSPMIQKTHEAQAKWAIFMPDNMNEALTAFTDVFMGLTALKRFKGYPHELTHSEEPAKDLKKAFENVIQTARKSIGTDPLSEGVLKTIGMATRQSDKED
jgi:hypothetical protein